MDSAPLLLTAFLGGFTQLELRRVLIHLEQQQRELEGLNAFLAEQSATDPLTGLHNRRAFQERLEAEVRRARHYRSPLSLLILDVDHFKLYNDAFGHPAGDEVLRRMAALLLDTTRRTDLVVRYGGEEFVVLLPNTEAQGRRAWLSGAVVLSRRPTGRSTRPSGVVVTACQDRSMLRSDVSTDHTDRCKASITACAERPLNHLGAR